MGRSGRAYRRQITPALAETLSIAPDAIPAVYGIDEYILARDLSPHDDGEAEHEVDLFARVV